MSARTVLAAIALALAAILGTHVVLLIAVAAVMVALGALAFAIARVVADCGWRVQPCRTRFAW